MLAPSSTVTPRPKTTFGSITTSGAIFVSKLSHTVSGAIIVTPSRISASRARVCQIASAAANCIAGIDAQHFVGIAFDDGGHEADGPRKLDRIGQIEFAFGVGIADVRQQVGNIRNSERQDARVADGNLALGLAGILFLADREKRAFAIGHKASVAGRVLRPKTEHCNVGAVIQRFLQAHQRLGSDQRRVGIKHDDVAAVPVECGTCREHGVGRSALRTLNEDLGGGRDRAGLAHDGFHLRSDDDRQSCAINGFCRFEDMSQHRAAGDFVQDFRLGGFHARALAGGEDDEQRRRGAHGRP